MFKVKITTKVWNVSECLSGQYFLNHRTFCYQIWYSDAASWARVMRTFFCCCRLQGHGHSNDLNMALSAILSELLIPWQPNLIWWYIIRSKCPMKKIGLLHSGSRLERRVNMLMFVQIISSKPLSILFSNLVLWFIITSQSAMQRDWFAIFKAKATARARIIKIWQFVLYLLNCWCFCYQTLFL